MNTDILECINAYVSRDLEKMCIPMNLLDNPDVIKWIKGETNFLLKKEAEDIWGRSVLKRKRPDLKLDKQWTNKFGEHLCEEVFQRMGKTVKSAAIKNGLHPDFETDDYIVEVKTGTYFTSGTAHEKIPGVPFKYGDVPELYQKPLKILCIGGAEKWAREHGLLPGSDATRFQIKMLNIWKEEQIEYMAFTDLLQELHLQGIPGF